MKSKRLHLLLIFGLQLVISGCTITGESLPTRFYILPNPTGAAEVASIRKAIGIAPVKLPRYLDRPQIVTLEEDDRVHLAEFHRWAEPLADGFNRVLAAGMTLRLPQSRFVSLPARQVKADRTLEIQVRDFQVREDRCLLLTDWRLQSGRTTQTWQRSTIEESISEGGYPGIVSAMGRAVDRLAGQIAAELAAMENQ
ncbi:MAG: PqiC family protein [Methylohalobius crimeensis]